MSWLTGLSGQAAPWCPVWPQRVGQLSVAVPSLSLGLGSCWHLWPLAHWAGVEGTRGRPCCTLLPVAGALECEIPTRKVSFSHSFPENASGLCLLACLVPIGQCTADGAGHCPEQPVSALGPGTHGPCGPPVQHCSWISRHLLDFRTARN